MLVAFWFYFGHPPFYILLLIAEVIDNFCWIQSTFTVPNVPGSEPLYPGVGPVPADEKDLKYQKYYQWVWIVLFLQALVFVIPAYLWRSVEKGKIAALVKDLQVSCPRFNLVSGTLVPILVTYQDLSLQ